MKYIENNGAMEETRKNQILHGKLIIMVIIVFFTIYSYPNIKTNTAIKYI